LEVIKTTNVLILNEPICKNNHVWREIESDLNAKPTKYKCLNCPLIYNVKKGVNPGDYFDRKNSVKNRIAENKQKIAMINLHNIGINERLHIDHLKIEIAKLREFLNQ